MPPCSNDRLFSRVTPRSPPIIAETHRLYRSGDAAGLGSLAVRRRVAWPLRMSLVVACRARADAASGAVDGFQHSSAPPLSGSIRRRATQDGAGVSLLLWRGGEFVVECATTCSGHVGDAGHDGRFALEVNVAPAQAQGEHGVSASGPQSISARMAGVSAPGLAHHLQKIGRTQPRAGPRCGDKEDLSVASPGLRHGRAGFLQGFDDAGCQAASSATSPGSGVPSSHCRKAPPAVET